MSNVDESLIAFVEICAYWILMVESKFYIMRAQWFSLDVFVLLISKNCMVNKACEPQHSADWINNESLLRFRTRTLTRSTSTRFDSPLFRAASKVAMLIPSNLAASFREINFSIGGPPFCQRCGCCFQNHMNALATEAASAWYLTLKNLLATFATHPWRWGHSGLRWRGCHNSTASFYSCAAEFPPSL